MPTPNEAYNTSSMRHGGLYVNVYRGRDNPVLLGVYLMETGTPTPSVIEVDRPDVDGGDNGFVWSTGKVEGSAVFQIDKGSTPTLQTGDMFLTTQVITDASGNGVASYFAIKAPAQNIDPTYRKQSCTIREDKHANAAMLAQILEHA